MDDTTHFEYARSDDTIDENPSFWVALYDVLRPSSFLRTQTKVLLVGALALGVFGADIMFAIASQVLTNVVGIDATVTFAVLTVVSVAYTVLNNNND